MTAGAIDCVRGTLSIATEELRFILDSSGAIAVVVQDAATLERLLPELPVHWVGSRGVDGCGSAVALGRRRCHPECLLPELPMCPPPSQHISLAHSLFSRLLCWGGGGSGG